jgi:hypothetical protein
MSQRGVFFFAFFFAMTRLSRLKGRSSRPLQKGEQQPAESRGDQSASPGNRRTVARQYS